MQVGMQNKSVRMIEPVSLKAVCVIIFVFKIRELMRKYLSWGRKEDS
jgi:hypothetical protein